MSPPNDQQKHLESAKESFKDSVNEFREHVADAVKTDKIAEQEKPAIAKFTDNVKDKARNVAENVGLVAPKPEPPKDNVVVDAAKTVSNDAREQIYKAAKPSEESK